MLFQPRDGANETSSNNDRGEVTTAKESVH